MKLHFAITRTANKNFLVLSQNCEKQQISSPCLSARNNSVPTGRIFMKLDIWTFYENISRTLKFHDNWTRLTGTLLDKINGYFTGQDWRLLYWTRLAGTLREDQYTLWSCVIQFFLEWELFQTKLLDKIKAHILRSIKFLSKIVPSLRWREKIL